jgi:hypothetical protein
LNRQRCRGVAGAARTIIKRARAALVLPLGAILEEDDVTRVTARDGSTFTSDGRRFSH